ncbi:LPS-assembly protein LptD [Lacisediminimonas profundi]|uniref:LPS-assembly protein LptD n=1 Tax=Lacisediminimonas profundi TaxID=2603856 RepID=UPI00124B4663|nr:LPS-assembly protein LptD [Lacisediminimonas profundi]
MTLRRRFTRTSRLVHALTVALSAAAMADGALAQGGPKPARPDESDAPTTVDAERLSGRPDREISLERDVEIQRGSMTLNADRADFDIVDDRVRATGNVRLRNFGDRYTGEELNLKLDTGEGYVVHPTYRLENNNAQGSAERLEFESRDRAVIEQGNYSTCEGPDPDWQLRAGKLTLDRERDIGTARNAVVIFKGVPLLASPYLSFPMTSERKSGLLPPSFGTSSRGGLQIQMPYYWNIAPNRDLTLYPRIIAQRGFQMGAQARYLGQTYSGQTRFEGMLDDQLAGRSRYAISSVHSQQLTPQLALSTNINAASDGNYPNDFTNTITTSTQRILLRDASLGYAGAGWTAYARASGYQVLQDPLSPIVKPYERLPQVGLVASRVDVKGFDLGFDSELTRFAHPTFVQGTRMVVNPRVSYPLIYPGFFVTPSASVHATSYNLTNQAAGLPTTFNRVLPTLSVDSGVVFERQTALMGRTLTQTLEPRLYYVYTPYKDQSQFPIFDTALADFNYTQMFRENRFSGHDRISDANQLTAAVSSRFIEESGVERMNVALAQRFYFNDQRVIGGLQSETKSDILLLGYGQVSSTVAVDSTFQYSQSLHSWQRTSFGVRWRPGANRVLNVQYRRDQTTPLRLFDISAQWPLTNRLYGVGRLNYSLQENRLAESVAGIEYKADCWIFRLVAQRIPTGTGVSTSTIFLQLELNGLSKIGSNPLQILRTNVPGYQSLTSP